MEFIDYNSTKEFYNKHTDCWASDLFSQMTTSFIDDFVNKALRSLKSDSILLNAGSGGKNYRTNAQQIHIDIAENTLVNTPNSYIGNVINMPFEDDLFDCIICVGTVINYCEADKAIKEFSRTSKKNSLLILEYERMRSGFVKEDLKGLDSTIFVHTYFQETHKNLLYSDSYIHRLLLKNNYFVKKEKKFNVTIPWIERFSSDKIAHRMVPLEKIFSLIPCINKYAHNKIMICQKHS